MKWMEKKGPILACGFAASAVVVALACRTTGTQQSNEGGLVVEQAMLTRVPLADVQEFPEFQSKTKRMVVHLDYTPDVGIGGSTLATCLAPIPEDFPLGTYECRDGKSAEHGIIKAAHVDQECVVGAGNFKPIHATVALQTEQPCSKLSLYFFQFDPPVHFLTRDK